MAEALKADMFNNFYKSSSEQLVVFNRRTVEFYNKTVGAQRGPLKAAGKDGVKPVWLAFDSHN